MKLLSRGTALIVLFAILLFQTAKSDDKHDTAGSILGDHVIYHCGVRLGMNSFSGTKAPSEKFKRAGEGPMEDWAYKEKCYTLIAHRRKHMRALCYLVAGLLALSSANAQSSGNLGTIGPIHRGLAVGAIVGVTAVGGVAITYLVLHNRGVAAGCIAESGGKKTLVGSDKKVSILLDTGASLPVGERVKLKGHKAGPASAPSFQVEKVLKDYGPCPP